MLMILVAVFLSLLARSDAAENFTIINGQIYTPGLAIVDAPQPDTPLGGDFLQVALDVSADAKLQLPPYSSGADTEIYNITIFLSSYDTGLNITISNGTATAGNASLGNIMDQEPGSTVKHVNWIWPDCLVGDGQSDDSNSSRGSYSISIRQNFKLNNINYYTIFDLPIEVTNEISDTGNRSSCDSLNNDLLTPEELNSSANILPALVDGVGSASTTSTGSEPSSTGDSGDGLGAGNVIQTPCGLWSVLGLAILVSIGLM